MAFPDFPGFGFSSIRLLALIPRDDPGGVFKGTFFIAVTPERRACISSRALFPSLSTSPYHLSLHRSFASFPLISSLSLSLQSLKTKNKNQTKHGVSFHSFPEPQVYASALRSKLLSPQTLVSSSQRSPCPVSTAPHSALLTRTF